MRWGGEKPGLLDTRYRSGFLFRPRFAQGEWRWLEIAQWVETLGTAGWYTSKWLD